VHVQLVLLLLGWTGSDLHHSFFKMIHRDRRKMSIRCFPELSRSNINSVEFDETIDPRRMSLISRLAAVDLYSTVPTEAGQTMA